MVGVFPITGIGSIQQPCLEDSYLQAQCYDGRGQALPKHCLGVIMEKWTAQKSHLHKGRRSNQV